MDKIALSEKKTKQTETTTTIRVAVAGPRGRMGREAVRMISENNNFTLVGSVDHKYDHKNTLNDGTPPVFTDVRSCLEGVKPDVFLDLTVPEVGYKHTKVALELGVRPVVGTTGFTEAQIKELTEIAVEKEIGCIIAPNFAIGAILMMKFSQMAARYFPDVEIIEKHHHKKVDAPSGTAIKTCELIKQAQQTGERKQNHVNETEFIKGVRGGNLDGIHIHSMRLPGLVAHQEVVFGNVGETLSIKHDSIDRSSFMQGIKFSIEKVMELKTCIYGLENIIHFDN